MDYPHTRYEVIVVDDGSPTPVETILTEFHDILELRIVTQSRAGPAAARNNGAAIAQGDTLAFTDDDCIPAVNWLSVLANRFTASPSSAVGGRIINSLPKNPYAVTGQMVTDSVYDYLNADHEHARFFASNNIAMPANLFRRVGGFDPSFTIYEDLDFCDRWVAKGLSLVYEPQAVVYHARQLTMASFCIQQFHYGKGAFSLYRAKINRATVRWRLEQKYYLHMLRSLAKRVFSQRMPKQAVLLIILQFAFLAGLLWHGVSEISSGCRVVQLPKV